MRKRDKKMTTTSFPSFRIPRLMAQKGFVHGIVNGNEVGVNNNPFHKISFWLATETDLHLMRNRSKYIPNFISLNNI